MRVLKITNDSTIQASLQIFLRLVCVFIYLSIFTCTCMYIYLYVHVEHFSVLAFAIVFVLKMAVFHLIFVYISMNPIFYLIHRREVSLS
jgi:hypothetical protein